jgi:thiamine biosynthesis lipoprotein
MEESLSRYRPNSDISKINNLQPGEFTVVGEDTLNCLVKSIEIFDLTNGAFDISLGKTIQAWKDEIPSKEESIDSPMNGLIIDKSNFTVLVENSINLDLGGIGKGYAAEKVSELFLDWEIENYLISCGNSTIKLKSSKINNFAWPITFTNPTNNLIFTKFEISNGSISSSGLLKGDHIINPEDLQPIANQRTSCWVYSDDAIISDALSTAFMIMKLPNIENICRSDSSISCLILSEDKNEENIIKFGDFFKSKIK